MPLFKLGLELLRFILQYLDIENVGVLDTAVSEQSDRQIFLELIQKTVFETVVDCNYHVNDVDSFWN